MISGPSRKLRQKRRPRRRANFSRACSPEVPAEVLAADDPVVRGPKAADPKVAAERVAVRDAVAKDDNADFRVQTAKR